MPEARDILMVDAGAVTRPGEIVRITLLCAAVNAALLLVFGSADTGFLVGQVVGGMIAANVVRAKARRA